jgi:thioesterase domain-containing protein/acyl transferase domain-containing protein
MLAEFASLVASVDRHAPSLPYLSNVTGDWITATEAQDPQYYARHIRQTVRFSEGVTRLMEKPGRLFLEMGPGRTLATFVSKHITDNAAVILPTIPGAQDDQPSSRYVMEALGKAWAAGAAIVWKALYNDESRRRIPLPTYPFDEKPYRLENQHTQTNKNSDDLKKHPNITEWFYSPGWRQQPAVAGSNNSSGWLLLGNLPEPIVTAIEHRKESISRSQAAPGDAQAFDTLFAELAAKDELPDQVLIGWTLDDTAFQPKVEAVDHGSARTVEIVRAIALAWTRHSGGHPLTIHFLTRDFNDVLGTERAQPQWSFLTASCLVATQELPAIRCRQLDLPAGLIDARLAESVLAECSAPDAEPCIAWRGGRRWVRDYAPIPIAEPPVTPLREGGVYLITGGLGRVGLLFAEHLAREAKAKLILLGRGAIPPKADWSSLVQSAGTDPTLAEKLKRLLEIEKLGGEVLTLSADAGNTTELAAAIATTRARFGTIHGVIHAAGIVSSQTIQQSSPEDLKHFLHAKPHGLLAIHQETRGMKLDFCLLTSSLSAVLGGLGYHAYAAGNAFLDQFARWANHDSAFPWISINWDAWKFPDDANAGSGSAMYRIAMTPEESLRVLDRVLAHPELSRNGLVISTAPLAPRLEQWMRRPVHQNTKPDAAPPPSTGTAIERMIGIWKNCLRREVAADDDYFELGGDSLMAVGLFTEIECNFGRALPLSSLFNSPTPAKLALLVSKEETGPVSEARPTPVASTAPDHVIPIRAEGNLRPLFCIHGADGGVLFYRDFGLQLDENRPIHAIEAPMLQNPQLHAADSVATIATAYLADIRRIQPEGPYLLGGYSFGGIVAYEMARQLKQAGITTTKLLLFDSPNPASPIHHFSLLDRIRTQWRLQGNAGFLRKLGGLGKRAASGTVFRLKLEIENRMAAKSGAAEAGYLRHIQSRQQHDALADTYQPLPYDGPTCLFIAQAGGGDKFAHEKNLGWNETLLPHLEVVEIPGSHLDIFREPYLTHLLKTTREVLVGEN